MIVEKTFIEDLLIVKPDVFGDERGFFYESFNADRYKKYGIAAIFVQDNISKSKKNTVRGLHYQTGKFAQGKLCSVVVGKVLDVAVDIRFGSPTFGKHFALELSDENKYQFWIPPGFAHGFSVLSQSAIFYYKCSNVYNKESERAIIYNDASLNINWMVATPVVSEKDLNAPAFDKIEKSFIFNK